MEELAGPPTEKLSIFKGVNSKSGCLPTPLIAIESEEGESP